MHKDEQTGSVGWHHLVIHDLAQIPAVTLEIDWRMARADYSPRDRFGVRLAVEEALVNAVKHGHQGDPARPVHVRLGVGTSKVLIEVEDQGPGFDPRAVPNPLAPENLERASGRGLLLMSAYSTWVRWNRQGNRVTLCRRRSPACVDSGVWLVGCEDSSEQPARPMPAVAVWGSLETLV